jgi:hypothetical protein
MFLRALAITGVLILVAGCATIFNPEPTHFTATSTPSGATVEVVALRTNESFRQTTPASFSLDRGSDYRLTFELEGYRSEEIIVRRTVNGWFIGSVLLGLLPAVVDFATNAMWDHTMTVANVDFVRSAETGAPEAIATIGITEEDGTFNWVQVTLPLQRM